MLHKLTLDEHKLIQELQNSGIPINFRPLKTESRISPAITLSQIGNRFDNAVHLPFGYNECCCVMTIAISNRSNRNVRLEACRLEIPWGVSHFRWLEKPRGNVAREFTYTHDAYCGAYGGSPLLIEPERVLNHRLARGLKVFPGETVEGMLIGAGDPELHHDPGTRELGLELILFDSRGHDYHLPVILKVLRKKPKRAIRRVSLEDLARNPLGKWLDKVMGNGRSKTKAELRDECDTETVEV